MCIVNKRRAAALIAAIIAGMVSVCISGASLADDPADQTAELNEKVLELYDAGQYARAVPIAQEVLAAREKLLPPDDIKVGDALNNLGELYAAQGLYPQAEPLLRRAAAVAEKALGSNDPAVGTSLDNLATVYVSLGRYSEAEKLYERALSIFESALGPDDSEVATVLNHIAALHQMHGRYAQAEPLIKRALSIRENTLGGSHPAVATALDSLASLYREQARYAEAEPLYEKALHFRETVLGPDHPAVGSSLNNLAALYWSEGRYTEAERLYQRCVLIWEKALGSEHPRLGTVLNNLAALYDAQGRYEDAQRLYERSLAVAEKAFGPDHPDITSVMSNLAGVYREGGRYADAESLLKRSLTIRDRVLGHEHPAVAGSLNELGILYYSQGRYTEAEPLYKRALAIREKTLGSNHPDVATALNNLAGLYERENRYLEAEHLLQRVVAIRNQTLSPEHPLTQSALFNLSFLYNEQGRYDDALPIVIRSIARDNADKTVALPVLAGAESKSLISHSSALEYSYDIAQRSLASSAASAVSQLAARFGAGTGELAGLVRSDQDLVAEANTLEKALVAFFAKPTPQRSAQSEDALRGRLDAVRTERDRLQRIFLERFPDYMGLSRPQPLSLQETQRLLANDEALIVFDFDKRSYLWLITSSAADWRELHISNAELENQVRKLRAGIADTRAEFDPRLAHRIYQELFAPIGDAIADKKRLSIVSNGAFTSLPPHLLVTTDPSGTDGFKQLGWFLRRHAITILPSVGSLEVLRNGARADGAPKPLLGFADPVFSKAAREAQSPLTQSIASFYRGARIDVAALAERLPQLPSTRPELIEIATQLKAGPEDLKLGLAANETAVKQSHLDQYRVLYFATHGLVAGDVAAFAGNQAEPALALSIPEAPDDFDDGLLTASEIAQLKLNADWVVLSACNTAAADKPGAEALSGLARAFFYAGAKSLVVSHWNVDDEAAAKLMTGTFRVSARDPKVSHAQALQRSMLDFIDTAKTDADASPWLWAPFVVVGEPAAPR